MGGDSFKPDAALIGLMPPGMAARFADDDAPAAPIYSGPEEPLQPVRGETETRRLADEEEEQIRQRVERELTMAPALRPRIDD